ncbi:MAG: sigma-70 family RNA polymerase sigma factor [Pirellulaceae bacterium]
MSGDNQHCDRTLAKYRPYLIVLAESLLHPRLRKKLDASDLVQETLLHAWQGWSGFRGDTEAERTAWLRTILGHVLDDAIRKFATQKWDLTRERSLEAEVEQSSCRLKNLLAADQSSPSHQAQENEQAVLLAAALVQLPESQRQAIVLQKFHGWSLKEIAESMEKSQTAVAGLLKRGLENLRGLTREWE